MDFSVKPVSETLFQDNHPFYTANKRIAENNLFTGDGQAGANAVQPVSKEITSPAVPEAGKGPNIDIYG